MICNLDALTEVFRKLPDDSAERTAHILNQHQRIFVYGAGRSGLMMKALAMRLAQAGRVVYVVGETVTPAITENDLLVLASASGRTTSVCRYAGIAKEAGADLLIMSAAPDSELAEIAGGVDVYFETPTKYDSGNPVSLLGTLFEQTLLLYCDQVVLHLNEVPGDMLMRHANLE